MTSVVCGDNFWQVEHWLNSLFKHSFGRKGVRFCDQTAAFENLTTLRGCEADLESFGGKIQKFHERCLSSSHTHTHILVRAFQRMRWTTSWLHEWHSLWIFCSCLFNLQVKTILKKDKETFTPSPPTTHRTPLQLPSSIKIKYPTLVEPTASRLKHVT